MILKVVDDVNTSVVAALVAEDDVLLLEAAADADVEAQSECQEIRALPNGVGRVD